MRRKQLESEVRAWPIPEQLKYFAARFAYRHRNNLCPTPVEINRKRVEITWEQWFEQRYGEALSAYIYRVRSGAATTQCEPQATAGSETKAV